MTEISPRCARKSGVRCGRSRAKRNNRWLAAAALLLLLAAFACCAYLFYLPKRHIGCVRACAAEFGVDEALVFAVIRAESGFREDAVSSAGAVGLMQLMPSTAAFAAASLGVEAYDLLDAADNIRLGAWYLGYLCGRFGRIDEALAAYNAGEGTVRRWLRDPSVADEKGRLAHIPYAETRRYVARVKNFYFCYKFFYG